MPARTPPPPPGQKWCSRHKSLHPAADFSPTDFYCRDGRREYERDRKAAPKPKPQVQPRRLPPDPIPVITLPPPKPAPVEVAPPPKQKGWRALPTKESVESDEIATTKADAVPAGEPWTREATEHEAAMLAHGANVVSQIRAAHFALDVITSGWALMNKGEE